MARKTRGWGACLDACRGSRHGRGLISRELYFVNGILFSNSIHTTWPATIAALKSKLSFQRILQEFPELTWQPDQPNS